MNHAEFDAHRRTVRLPQGEVAYAEFGEGPAAVFVHGVFLHGALWRNVIEALASTEQSRRCIAVDLPAHGRTRLDAGQPINVAAQAEVLLGLCDALGLDQVDLVGNDTGGAVCQVFAARHPDRIRTLALTNCDTEGNLPPARFRPAVELARAGGLAPILQQLAADLEAARSENGIGIGFEHPDRLTLDDVRSYGMCAATEDAARETERFIAALDDADLLDVGDELRRFDRPTLLAWGTDDVFFEMARAEWLRDTIPGADEIVPIEGGKLFYPDERGPELAAHLARHWAKVRAA